MKLRIISLLLAVTVYGCFLLSSCSKSLTDIGYQSGRFDTNIGYEPFGPNGSNGEVFLGASHYPLVSYDAFTYLHSSDIANTNMRVVDKKLLEETAKKQCVKFARKFYTSLLSPKFRAEKFSKKYRSSCLRMLNEAVDSAATASDRYKGWQIFNDGNLKPKAAVSVTYDGGAWFKISQADNPDACVYVLMIVPDVKKDPKIAGIKYQSGQIIPEGV